MVRYLACLRFELLTTVLLLALPLASSSTLIGNLFRLEARGELALVIALCCLIAWQIMVMVLLVLERAPDQLGLPEARIPAWVTAWRVPLFTVLAGPSVAAVVMLADRADWAGRLTGLGLGLGLAFAVLWLTTLAQQLLISPGTSRELLLDPRLWVPRWIRERPGMELPLPRSASRILGPGIVSPEGGFQPGFGLAVALALVSYLLYLVGWVALDPLHPRLGRLTLPALGYFLLLGLAIAWVLTLTAFWLDRHRVPTTLAVTLVAAITFTLAQQDHYFGVVRSPSAAAMPAPAAVQSWLETQPAGRPAVMVVVTAAGGGIRAAAWTATVLGQLETLVPGFHRSVALISAVSGGAVGTMYFLDAIEDFRRTPAKALKDLYARAAASSLTATAWGLVYPDLSRTFPSPVLLATPPTVDRAWMTEQVWDRRLLASATRGGPVLMSEWTERVRQGDLPPFVFNATSVETGQRVLFGAVRIIDPEDRQPVGVLHFDDLYPERDIAVTTAARLSATFPYVFPVARARRVDPTGPAEDLIERQSDHFADGGYNDNFGTATAVDWLRAVLPAYRKQIAAVLVLRIELEPDSSVTHVPGFVNAVLGPLTTLYEVRDATQTARNAVALALLATAYENAPRICEFVFRPIPTDSRPLSWHLTTAERQAIRDQWPAYEAQAQQIGSSLHGMPADCPPPGTG